MKTIYVTVKEFEDNGGIIEDGRMAFIRNHEFNVFQTAGNINSNTRTASPFGLRVHMKNGGMYSVNELFVKIEVAPIYK